MEPRILETATLRLSCYRVRKIDVPLSGWFYNFFMWLERASNALNWIAVVLAGLWCLAAIVLGFFGLALLVLAVSQGNPFFESVWLPVLPLVLLLAVLVLLVGLGYRVFDLVSGALKKQSPLEARAWRFVLLYNACLLVVVLLFGYANEFFWSATKPPNLRNLTALTWSGVVWSVIPVLQVVLAATAWWQTRKTRAV